MGAMSEVMLRLLETFSGTPLLTAAQTRMVSVARNRLDPQKSCATFKGIFCHDNRVRLPTRHFDDCGDSAALLPLEHLDYTRLLGPLPA
jgi:hypothetical protein